MGRAPCCDKANVKKGPWSPEEDAKLKDYIDKYGTGGNWIALPHKAGLRRCGKSCRLRWLNYLRPNIKHGDFTDDEDRIICSLFASIGSRWSIIAAQLPGRTDNDIKNYWNTKLKKKLMGTTPSSSSQKRILQSTVPAYLSSASLTPSAAHTWAGVIGGDHEAANYYYTTQGQVQAGLMDNLSLISSHLFNTSTTTTSSSSSLNTAAQEGYNYSTSTTSSMQNYQVQEMSFLRFGSGGAGAGGGGDQASSSSSDGSSTYDYGASNVVNINNNNNNNNNNNPNMNYFSSNYVADNPLDDSLEEIKQLISTTNLCNNLFVHEIIKTEEKVTYY